MSVLSAPHFHSEQAAYAYVEARLWPNGPICPHCGGFERISKMGGKSTRIGTYKCYQCRKPFTVKVGTIFEASHVPLRHWLQVMFLMASSKKGISTNQIQRTLGCHMKTAWFVGHRLREAMRDGVLGPFGVGGATVEADETYIGRDPDHQPRAGQKPGGYQHKMKVLSLVERETGRARSVVMPAYDIGEVQAILRDNLSWEAKLMTDESGLYVQIGRKYASHGRVNHSRDEYVSKTDPTVHTNTIEGFFSVFKRGMRGIYQHCAKKHLHRYLAEFDFRYTNRVALGVNDVERADMILTGAKGKRLTYRPTDGGAEAVTYGPQAPSPSSGWEGWQSV
jgi:transposase-like protein